MPELDKGETSCMAVASMQNAVDVVEHDNEEVVQDHRMP